MGSTTTIENLPDAAPLTGAEYLALDQTVSSITTTVKAPLSDVLNLPQPIGFSLSCDTEGLLPTLGAMSAYVMVESTIPANGTGSGGIARTKGATLATPIVVYSDQGLTIASGTYNSGTGAVSLTTGAAHGLTTGSKFLLSNLTGTGSIANLNGAQTATAGTTGSTLNFTAATSLTLTITGGNYSAGIGIINFAAGGQNGRQVATLSGFSSAAVVLPAGSLLVAPYPKSQDATLSGVVMGIYATR